MIDRRLVVIGAGPAGLSAAIEAAKTGCPVLLIDENARPGGQLFKQIHKFFGSRAHHAGTRGYYIGTELLEETQKLGIEVWLNSEVCGIENGNEIWIVRDKKKNVRVRAEKIIIATGATENAVTFPGWDIPGVMGAGAAQTMINVNRVLPGEKIIMVGSGNVGVIVSYQLLQAGADVVAIVEAAPKLGGYGVHTAKVCRAGVPFYTSTTIKEAFGDKRVERVELVDLDDHFQQIPGTERMLEADTVCLATGLTPLTELAWIAGCQFDFVPALGGNLPIHNKEMRTTMENIYVAGDIAGVEEASTAMEEGKLAGINAAAALGYLSADEAVKRSDAVWNSLDALRCGYFGQRRKDSKDYMLKKGTEVIG
ncbi:Thioredoxin reductase [uncultured Clostridium sp.]|uniref:FAD-dependent oxidoreductase n=1 Tax=Flintibacter hominis TaxID=2763048 RepID=A0A8J6MC97_9FIRM|nr:NAD(P)/FAD-dependent oxidoreductase [Flintibacter hominis]MBC5721611.1 FAD-dependent oxidoreductase [Flintibacter hominis]SCH72814.1 Thioredoxin reductase [uncultured Clostridium sp.]